MQDDIKIVTTYENNQIQLVFNESFLCPIRDIGIVDLNLGQSVSNWKLRLIFDKNDSDKPFATKWEYNVDDFQIRLTLFNWNSNTWIEFTKAQAIKSSKETYYFKLRTDGNPALENVRNIHLSIWKVI